MSKKELSWRLFWRTFTKNKYYFNRSFVDGKLTSKDIISSRIIKFITNPDTAVRSSAKPNPISDSNKGNVFSDTYYLYFNNWYNQTRGLWATSLT